MKTFATTLLLFLAFCSHSYSQELQGFYYMVRPMTHEDLERLDPRIAKKMTDSVESYLVPTPVRMRFESRDQTVQFSNTMNERIKHYETRYSSDSLYIIDENGSEAYEISFYPGFVVLENENSKWTLRQFPMR